MVTILLQFLAVKDIQLYKTHITWINSYIFFVYKPRHEISNNGVYATSRGSDQPAQARSLIRAFASRLNVLWSVSY